MRLRPRPFFSSAAAIASIAGWNSRPLNSPEFTVMPYSVNASCHGGSTFAYAPVFDLITCTIGSWFFSANS